MLKTTVLGSPVWEISNIDILSLIVNLLKCYGHVAIFTLIEAAFKTEQARF